MNFKKGDLVTRKSHNNDIVFEILEFNNDSVFLKGIEVRLIADSDMNDLVKVVDTTDLYKNDRELTEEMLNSTHLDRDDFFYLPGRILHIARQDSAY